MNATQKTEAIRKANEAVRQAATIHAQQTAHICRLWLGTGWLCETCDDDLPTFVEMYGQGETIWA